MSGVRGKHHKQYAMLRTFSTQGIPTWGRIHQGRNGNKLLDALEQDRN